MLEKERSLQIEQVPFVSLLERVDGKNREQLEEALRQQIRRELAFEVRREILDGLRRTQIWTDDYGKAYRRAEGDGQLILMIVHGQSDSGEFYFDEAIADALQADLLSAFQLCKVTHRDPAAQFLLRRRGGAVLPMAFVIDARRRIVIHCQQGVNDYLKWGQLLVAASQCAARRGAKFGAPTREDDTSTEPDAESFLTGRKTVAAVRRIGSVLDKTRFIGSAAGNLRGAMQNAGPRDSRKQAAEN